MIVGMTSVAALYDQAMELTADDRAVLVELLVETIREKDPGYDEAGADAFDRRMAEHDADPDSAIPWDEAMNKIFAPFRPR